MREAELRTRWALLHHGCTGKLMHVYLEVSPLVFNGTYCKVAVQRTAALNWLIIVIISYLGVECIMYGLGNTSKEKRGKCLFKYFNCFINVSCLDSFFYIRRQHIHLSNPSFSKNQLKE